MSTQIGIIGLGTMGSALARNLASRGFKVSVWNRSPDKVEKFIKEFGSDSFYGAEHFEDFVESLERPRRVILMLPAGQVTQEMVDHLKQALASGDCVMDGGNAFYKNTEEVEQTLLTEGILFLGCGVSGGEEGALKGPSLMPGGSFEAWQHFEPLLTAISAEDFKGRACVAYMGKGGAGHYVKMVHNGIEYAEMQVLAEAYGLLHQVYKLSQEEIAAIFSEWNSGTLGSFLLEISIDVLQKEQDGQPLLDLILDKADQKGTGMWTSQEALNLGVAAPSLAAAVFARNLSADKETRVELSKSYSISQEAPKLLVSDFVQYLEHALVLSRLSHFEQGLRLLKAANAEYEFNLPFPEIFRIWQGGCIIRNVLLKDMQELLGKGESGFYASTWGQKNFKTGLKSWRTVVATAAQVGHPLFSLSASLAHFEAYRSERLPANFIQGLRDRFGSHGYERVDLDGTFHSHWL